MEQVHAKLFLTNKLKSFLDQFRSDQIKDSEQLGVNAEHWNKFSYNLLFDLYVIRSIGISNIGGDEYVELGNHDV